MNRLILGIIILLELATGVVVLVTVYQKRNENKVLGIVSPTIIHKEDIIETNELKNDNYYELQPAKELIEDSPALVDKAVYTINNDGLNERFDYEVSKPPNVFRIVALGDSFTFGQGVNTSDNWTEQLEELLTSYNSCSGTKYEVINLGMRGFDIKYIVKRYEKKGLKYKPNLVVWYESSSGYQRNLDRMMPMIEKCRDESEKIYPLTITGHTDEYYQCWFLAENTIKKEPMRGLVREENTKSLDYFMRLVEPSQFYYLSLQASALSSEDRDTYLYWKQRYPKVTILDPVLPFSTDELLRDAHPSPKGHQKIAKYIYQTLLESEQTIRDCQHNY